MSIIKHVTLQKIVAHDFRYDPRIYYKEIKVALKQNNKKCKKMETQIIQGRKYMNKMTQKATA